MTTAQCRELAAVAEYCREGDLSAAVRTIPWRYACCKWPSVHSSHATNMVGHRSFRFTKQRDNPIASLLNLTKFFWTCRLHPLGPGRQAEIASVGVAG